MKTTKKFIATNLLKRGVHHSFGQSPYRYSISVDGQAYRQESDGKVTTTDTNNNTLVIADAFTKKEFIDAVYNFIN